jgi:hypothetical protein
MWLSDEVWVTIDRADSGHVQCTRCSTEQTASNFTVFVKFHCVFVGVTLGTPAVHPKHDTGFAFRNSDAGDVNSCHSLFKRSFLGD